MYSWYWEKYDETPPRYEDIFEVVQSDAAYNKFTSAIGLGDLLEKPEGEDLQSEKPMESYTIVCKNRTWGRITQMTFEAVEDAQKTGNFLQETVGTWGNSAPRTKDKWYSNFFNMGAITTGNDVFNNTISGVVDDSSGNLIYDGQAFFADSHPDKVGNTYDNYNNSTALTQSNLQSVYTQYTVTNAKDERGNPVELIPDVLLIPPALRFTAQAILESTLIPGSMDNDTNVVRALVSPMQWAHLTDADGWFLGKLKMGLMATDRMDVTLDFWQDETNKDYYASIITRFGGCVTNWRFWLANNIDSS
jgi:hypothetical protein